MKIPQVAVALKNFRALLTFFAYPAIKQVQKSSNLLDNYKPPLKKPPVLMKYLKRKISKSGNIQQLVESYHDPHKVQTLSAQISWSYNIIKTNFQTFEVHRLIPVVKILKQNNRGQCLDF